MTLLKGLRYDLEITNKEMDRLIRRVSALYDVKQELLEEIQELEQELQNVQD